MSHAFLIIAHNEYELLRRLVLLLDHPDNDIYIHIDKKSAMPEGVRTEKSRLFFLEKRLDVRWGDVSQIKSEYLLFKTAFRNGPYQYYHLLSGVDLPIKPMSVIHQFFDENNGKEFVGFMPRRPNTWIERVMKYHFFTRHYRITKHGRLVTRKLREWSENVVNSLFSRSIMDFRKGSNWVSITNDFCSFLLSMEKAVLKRFNYTALADEVFLQTVIWNSPFRDKVYDFEVFGNVREIDWERGEPYVWGG